MIRSYPTLITSISVTSPVKVFSGTTDGGAVTLGGGGAISNGQQQAITTVALCNAGSPTINDETVNSVTVNIYLVKYGLSYGPQNLIVSNLVIPAGETVFFSEERIVLDAGDEMWVGTSAAALLAVTVSSLPV
jgi:hypothetical protein